MRAEDTLVCARFLTTYRMTATPNRVRLVAIGEATIPGLHAAASLPNLFTAVELDGCLKSWMDVVRGADDPEPACERGAWGPGGI